MFSIINFLIHIQAFTLPKTFNSLHISKAICLWQLVLMMWKELKPDSTATVPFC